MPSEKILEAKKTKVEQLTDILKNSVSGVLVDYKGALLLTKIPNLERVREAGVNYFVEKNTCSLAFKNIGGWRL